MNWRWGCECVSDIYHAFELSRITSASKVLLFRSWYIIFLTFVGLGDWTNLDTEQSMYVMATCCWNICSLLAAHGFSVGSCPLETWPSVLLHLRWGGVWHTISLSNQTQLARELYSFPLGADVTQEDRLVSLCNIAIDILRVKWKSFMALLYLAGLDISADNCRIFVPFGSIKEKYNIETGLFATKSRPTSNL